MRFSTALFATDHAVNPVTAAVAAEVRGFHAFYVPEHTHIPVERGTPHPLTGDTLNDEYRRTLDPWVTLAAVSSATEHIRLGTSIALVAEHHPITLAKEIATLDYLSGGRVVLGMGYGWNLEEVAHFGVDPSQRRAVVRECVLAMQALWTQDEAAFSGEFVRFGASWSWPKPVQPRLPVLVGGAAGTKTFAHIAEYADGWMPHGGAGLGTSLPVLRQVWDDAGRDPSSLEVVIMGVDPDPGKLEHYRSLGVDEIVLGFPTDSTGEMERALDGYAGIIAEFS
ncbi:MAG: LLM class F420-dependent oxidoreductase [Acidimicrobiales bacterium]|jgi:probable F420-dependent oxidoreductase